MNNGSEGTNAFKNEEAIIFNPLNKSPQKCLSHELFVDIFCNLNDIAIA